MNKITILLFAILMPVVMCAQAPEKMSYQAVIRDADNDLLVNSSVGMQISILQGAEEGTPVYVETHAPATNENGLISIEIGNGTIVLGDFPAIDWASGPFFIKTEVDLTGGNQYTITGITQLLSVPFALYAKHAENTDDADADPVNELQLLSLSNDTLYLSNGGSVKLPLDSGFSGDYNDLINKPDFQTAPNILIGAGAGENTPSNKIIIAIGDSALHKNGVGGDSASFYSSNVNIAVGNKAMYDNTTGINNTAVGHMTLPHNTTGRQNVAVGHVNLYENTSGSGNTAIGDNALYSNNGNNNTAVGIAAHLHNTTGRANVAVGAYALYAGTGRNNLVAIGDSALFNNGKDASDPAHASGNTAVGSKVMFSNTTGSSNTALGFWGLHDNTTGSGNTAVGSGTLQANTTGYDNTAGGFQALSSSTYGYRNSAFGNIALSANTSGFRNSAFGDGALVLNTAGVLNTALGSYSLPRNTTGNYNTACGTIALLANQTGNFNTAVGYNSGFIMSATGLNNTTAIGNGAQVSSDNTVRLGNSSVTTIGGSVAWSNLSDGRFKTNVQPNVPGLDFILKLKPITYTWDIHKLDEFLEISDSIYLNSPDMEKSRTEKEKKIYTGFIAQEVEQVAVECGFDFSGVVKPENEKAQYQLSYAEFVVPLVKAVQELSRQNEALKNELEELKAAIQTN